MGGQVCGKACGSMLNCSTGRSDAKGKKATIETSQEEIAQMRMMASQRNESEKEKRSSRSHVDRPHIAAAC